MSALNKKEAYEKICAGDKRKIFRYFLIDFITQKNVGTHCYGVPPEETLEWFKNVDILLDTNYLQQYQTIINDLQTDIQPLLQKYGKQFVGLMKNVEKDFSHTKIELIEES